MTKVLITGAAGFIGSNLAKYLADKGLSITGLDSISPYPTTNFKLPRLNSLGFKQQDIEYNKLLSNSRFEFIQLDLNDAENLKALFDRSQFDFVLHLAGQTGVRYSVENPLLYIENNIKAFCSLLEVCKEHPIRNVLYSSSSSVYGSNDRFPYEEKEPTDSPMSVYAATKKSDELIAHSYSSLHKLATTGLRFFTVYGPWTRTNMAVYLFIKAINDGTPIKLFNDGEMYRDFTYVEDVATSIHKLLENIVDEGNSQENKTPFDIYNIGSQNPVKIVQLIKTIEKSLGKKAIIDPEPLQAGDMVKTFADTAKLFDRIGYQPDTSLENGIDKTVQWYLTSVEQWKKTLSYS